MGRSFTDADRQPLQGRVELTTGESIDVTGAVLSEEGRAMPGEPRTKSRQCRVVYFRLPDGGFILRRRKGSAYEHERVALSSVRKRPRAVPPPEPAISVRVLLDDGRGLPRRLEGDAQRHEAKDGTGGHEGEGVARVVHG